MATRTDGNDEDAAQHLRNALQILVLATAVARGGPVTLSPDDVEGIKWRIRNALALLTHD